MNLFGCKFCDRDPETKEKMNCDRKNFDSLLWATVTVFQVCKILFDFTVGQKIKNSQDQKKLIKSNKLISQKKFHQIPFFAISKMAKTQFLNRGKKFKTAKNTI